MRTVLKGYAVLLQRVRRVAAVSVMPVSILVVRLPTSYKLNVQSIGIGRVGFLIVL
jgi:hypothetical protein